MKQTIINEIEKIYNYCIETKSTFNIVVINKDNTNILNVVAIEKITFISNQDNSIYLNTNNGLGAILDFNKLNLECYKFMIFINDRIVKEIEF